MNYHINIRDIDNNDILRYLGYKSNKPDEKTYRLISECKKEILNNATYQYTYAFYNIEKLKSKSNPQRFSIKLSDVNIFLEGNSIKKHLNHCDRCAIICATLGSEVDRLIRYYSVSNITKALILDACATANIELLINNIQSSLKEILIKDNFLITNRFSPGYGDFPLNIQPKLLNILGAYKIGLSCNTSHLLIPQKSVTAIIGISKNIIDDEVTINCNSCTHTRECLYTKEGEANEYIK